MLRSIRKQSREFAESVVKKKRQATVGRICRKGRFKPGMKEWRGDGWWEWWVDGTNGGSATRRTGTGWVRIGEISAWLTERSRELLIPETSGSIVEGTICYSGPVTTNSLPVTVLDLAQSISVFHSTDWLNHWMSLLWHLTNRRWNYNARINKWYSLYNKKLQFAIHICYWVGMNFCTVAS